MALPYHDPSMPMFLSPHLDDVAFSCSGVLCHHRARNDEAIVVTVFAGAPPSDLPIRPLHRDVIRDPDVTLDKLRELRALRLSEDEAAMKVLDARAVRLPFADAVFRPEIERWSNVWSEPVNAPDITPMILDTWRAHGGPIVYAPLGVGGHVDHRLCFAAARALVRAGADVWHYEDHPYSTRPGRLEARLAELDGWRSRIVDIRAHQARRDDAVACYRSQLRGIPVPVTSDERLWCSP